MVTWECLEPRVLPSAASFFFIKSCRAAPKIRKWGSLKRKILKGSCRLGRPRNASKSPRACQENAPPKKCPARTCPARKCPARKCPANKSRPQARQNSALNSAIIYGGRIRGGVLRPLWTGTLGASPFAIVGKEEAPGVPWTPWGPQGPMGRRRTLGRAPRAPRARFARAKKKRAPRFFF